MTPPKQRRETWLTPYADDYIDRFGGNPAFGPLAQTLRPIVEKYGHERTRPAWRRWLEQQTAAFVSIPKFGQTIGVWMGEKPAEGDKSQGILDMMDDWAKNGPGA